MKRLRILQLILLHPWKIRPTLNLWTCSPCALLSSPRQFLCTCFHIAQPFQLLSLTSLTSCTSLTPMYYTLFFLSTNQFPHICTVYSCTSWTLVLSHRTCQSPSCTSSPCPHASYSSLLCTRTRLQTILLSGIHTLLYSTHPPHYYPAPHYYIFLPSCTTPILYITTQHLLLTAPTPLSQWPMHQNQAPSTGLVLQSK